MGQLKNDEIHRELNHTKKVSFKKHFCNIERFISKKTTREINADTYADKAIN